MLGGRSGSRHRAGGGGTTDFFLGVFSASGSVSRQLAQGPKQDTVMRPKMNQ